MMNMLLFVFRMRYIKLSCSLVPKINIEGLKLNPKSEKVLRNSKCLILLLLLLLTSLFIPKKVKKSCLWILVLYLMYHWQKMNLLTCYTANLTVKIILAWKNYCFCHDTVIWDRKSKTFRVYWHFVILFGTI